LESGDRIWIEIRRIWHRSTARNMRLTVERKLFTQDRIRKSTAGKLYATIG